MEKLLNNGSLLPITLLHYFGLYMFKLRYINIHVEANVCRALEIDNDNLLDAALILF